MKNHVYNFQNLKIEERQLLTTKKFVLFLKFDR